MPVHLTEPAIKNAVQRAAELKQRIDLADAGQQGLWLRITPNGARSWVLSCRDSNGQTRRFSLGQYPQIGLAKARLDARAMREKVRQGADPIAAAREKREAAKEAKENPTHTLTDLLDLYGRQRGGTLRTWPEYRRRIESVFAPQLKIGLDELRLSVLQMQADRWPKQQSAGAAVRYLRPILKWAAARGRAYVAKELTELTPPVAVARRERVLSRDELAMFLPALMGRDDGYAAACMFMLLTLARREEVCGATWREFDFTRKTWTIPAERTKSERMHVVPLSRQALAVLRARQTDGSAPDALIFATATGRVLRSNWDRWTKSLMIGCGLARENERGDVVMCDGSAIPHRHDLRRTSATLLGELGTEPHIIEAALNHKDIGSAIASIYNRYRYQPQVADALQRLADALDGIATGAAVVVPIGHKRDSPRPI